MNECREFRRNLNESIAEALKKNDWQGALGYCRELLQIVADPGIEALRKSLMNKMKDEAINENIRRFVAGRSLPLPPRETVLAPEVLIPCFNQGRFLRQALASLPADLPATVIDDASTDDTAEHIAALKTEFSFRLITNEANLNQSGSLNKAIAASGGNLFIVLNADDALVRYAVATVLDIMEWYPDIRLVGGDCIQFAENTALDGNRALPGRLPYRPRPRIFLPADALGFTHPNDINMTMSGCSFLRSAWEAAGGFWEFERRVCSFDDRDFQMRVCALFPAAVLTEPLAFYRVNSSLGRGRSL